MLLSKRFSPDNSAEALLFLQKVRRISLIWILGAKTQNIQLFIDGCVAELTNSDCTAIAHFELDAAECESAVVALESSGECGAALYSVGN